VGPVAQRSEQRTHNPLVLGSNPSGPTKFFPLLILRVPLLQWRLTKLSFFSHCDGEGDVQA
jgi:hypothetical protein